MPITTADVDDTVRVLVRLTGQLARFCDRAEHNEGTERGIVGTVAGELRLSALRLLEICGADPIAAYLTRLAEIEARHPLAGEGLFEAAGEVGRAKTWRDLQRSQARHDAVYHPDVVGLAKIDQLRHYTLHLAKLAWLLQEYTVAGDPVDASAEARVVDLLVFGVKLSTVCGELLPEEAVW